MTITNIPVIDTATLLALAELPVIDTCSGCGTPTLDTDLTTRDCEDGHYCPTCTTDHDRSGCRGCDAEAARADDLY